MFSINMYNAGIMARLMAFYLWQEFSPLTGGNETPARYEEKEAGDVRKTNRMPEGKSGMWLVNTF